MDSSCVWESGLSKELMNQNGFHINYQEENHYRDGSDGDDGEEDGEGCGGHGGKPQNGGGRVGEDHHGRRLQTGRPHLAWGSSPPMSSHGTSHGPFIAMNWLCLKFEKIILQNIFFVKDTDWCGRPLLDWACLHPSHGLPWTVHWLCLKFEKIILQQTDWVWEAVPALSLPPSLPWAPIR